MGKQVFFLPIPDCFFKSLMLDLWRRRTTIWIKISGKYVVMCFVCLFQRFLGSARGLLGRRPREEVVSQEKIMWDLSESLNCFLSRKKAERCDSWGISLVELKSKLTFWREMKLLQSSSAHLPSGWKWAVEAGAYVTECCYFRRERRCVKFIHHQPLELLHSNSIKI